MTRRDVFRSIAASLAASAVPGVASATVDGGDAMPKYIAVRFDKDVDINQEDTDRIASQVTKIIKQHGWNIPVFVIPPCMSFDTGAPVNVTIPPNTVVEQLADYTFIGPVGVWKEIQAERSRQ